MNARATMALLTLPLPTLLGCGAPPADGAGGSETIESTGVLDGTSWQLVEFQSSSDEIGVIRPSDPDAYLMTLGADGTAALRLDCNRGTGTWTAEFTEIDRGPFGFGPLAVTRALCPDDDLGQRIARDAEFVRSFVLDGRRLYLNLMADAGTWVWEAAPDG